MESCPHHQRPWKDARDVEVDEAEVAQAQDEVIRDTAEKGTRGANDEDLEDCLSPRRQI